MKTVETTVVRPHTLLSTERQEMADLIAQAEFVAELVRRLMAAAEQADSYSRWEFYIDEARALLAGKVRS